MSHASRHASVVLSTVPDEPFGERLGEWFGASLSMLRAAGGDDFTPGAVVAVDLDSVAALPLSPFGRYASSEWRRLVAAMLLADWSCYVEPVDWMSFERLAFMAHVFPGGFRSWWARHRNGCWLPVGYTAWHPISEAAFVTLEQHAQTLRDRTLIPLPSVEPDASFVCIVNFSIVAPLRKTPASKEMLQALAEDLAGARAAGLAAIAVSGDGARVVERFGLKRSSTLRIGSAEEWVFTWRRGEAAG